MPVWERRDDEPNAWYSRFELYRALGPRRTVDAAYRRANNLLPDDPKRPGASWYAAAKRFAWQSRAEAWDAAERARTRAAESDRRHDERERRLTLIDRLLDAVMAVIDGARIHDVSMEQARSLLPTMRLFFRDLIAAQRAELGLPDPSGIAAVPYTADELLAASRAAHGELRLQPLRDVLAELYPDEGSVRRVAQSAGLNMARVRMQPTAVDTWHGVLMEAYHSDLVEALITVVRTEYAANRGLLRAIESYRTT